MHTDVTSGQYHNYSLNINIYNVLNQMQLYIWYFSLVSLSWVLIEYLLWDIHIKVYFHLMYDKSKSIEITGATINSTHGVRTLWRLWIRSLNISQWRRKYKEALTLKKSRKQFASRSPVKGPHLLDHVRASVIYLYLYIYYCVFTLLFFYNKLSTSFYNLYMKIYVLVSYAILFGLQLECSPNKTRTRK